MGFLNKRGRWLFLLFLVSLYVKITFSYSETNNNLDIKPSRLISPMIKEERHKFITELSASIFKKLNIPPIPCHFQDLNNEKPDVLGQYESTPNLLIFFDVPLTDADSQILTWVIWHEILHYYHELKFRDNNQFFYISNIGEFDFKSFGDHRNTIEGIFNDLQDYIVEKQIASLNMGVKPDVRQRIVAYKENIAKYKNGGLPLANMRNGVLMDFIKIAHILNFCDLPKDSEIHEMYSYLSKDIKDEILSNLEKLAYGYPNDNPKLMSKIFNLMSPRYRLTFDLKYIKEFRSAQKEFPFWFSQDKVRRVWTFVLHNK